MSKQRGIVHQFNMNSEDQRDFSVVLGSTNKIWLNDEGDGGIAVGGSTKSSAPFQVAADGTFIATKGTLKTGTSGKRIEIDGSNGEISIYNASAKQGSILGSASSGQSFLIDAVADMMINAANVIHLNTDLDQVQGITIKDAGVSFFNGDPDFGLGDLVIFIGNRASAPSNNPTNGGILYAESGALKYRGSSGTVTTIAAA